MLFYQLFGYFRRISPYNNYYTVHNCVQLSETPRWRLSRVRRRIEAKASRRLRVYSSEAASCSSRSPASGSCTRPPPTSTRERLAESSYRDFLRHRVWLHCRVFYGNKDNIHYDVEFDDCIRLVLGPASFWSASAWLEPRRRSLVAAVAASSAAALIGSCTSSAAAG